MAGNGRVGSYLSALSAALVLCMCSGATMMDWEDDDWDPKKLYCNPPSTNQTIFDIPINIGISGEPLDWNYYRGSVVLVINVASF
jgi:hypothetical protein